ncbi:MAG TPA: RNA polymerase sigma-70 factor [Pelobium sp.]
MNVQELCLKIALEDCKPSFKLFYDFYYERLFKLAKSITNSTEDAEEIVNDVFIKIWVNRIKLCQIENIDVYLFVLIKNAAITNIRQAKRNFSFKLDDLSVELKDIQLSPEMKVISKENVSVINSSIQKLPTQCKLIFKMAKEDGLKYKEIAEILEISIKTVEYHIGVALKRISDEVAPALNNFKKNNT